MKCIICGADLVENAVFCGNCGNAVVKESSAEEVQEIIFEEDQKEEVAPAEREAPQKAEPTSQEKVTDKKKGKKEKKKNPGTLFGVLALVFGLISFLTGAICTCPFSIAGGFLPLVVAVLGIVFGFLGISKSKKAGCKNVLGVIAIILSALSAVSILLLVIANVVLDLTGVADQLTF